MLNTLLPFLVVLQCFPSDGAPDEEVFCTFT